MPGHSGLVRNAGLPARSTIISRCGGGVISVQSMLSTLVGSMTANATEAFATAAELSPKDALALTREL